MPVYINVDLIAKSSTHTELRINETFDIEIYKINNKFLSFLPFLFFTFEKKKSTCSFIRSSE